VKLSEYQAMCVSLIQALRELRRLRAAVRAAQKTRASELAKRSRKKLNDARLKGAHIRQRASRRKKHRQK
jgi:hypothetical protein